MSSLLKEAIVDARALREAALKNAESSIIEKYSNEVRETLDKLIELEEPMLDLEEPVADIGMPSDDLGAPEVTSEDITENDVELSATDGLSAHTGEHLDKFSNVGDSNEVEINLGALQEALKELDAAVNEEEIELTEEDIQNIMSEDDEVVEESTEEVQEEEISEETVTEEDDTQTEALSIDDLTNAIVEKLTVDMGADLSGWAGRPAESVKWEMEKELAHRRSTDLTQDLKDLKKAQEELVFENNQVKEQNTKYKQAVQELQEGLQDVNLSNARLLYTNRILRNTSLNERQKDKIVEAISSVGSVAEARTVFETLQSTVESSPTEKRPQSLSEAISKRSTMLRATRQESTPSDPLQERMKRLAGIK